ncbi:putative heterokaryon incompatibility protein [Diplodia seriata]|uniref:Putative heterokaryon incompatibility protein n=1 Tax=Diplodia seriata TaxID=420778 RepID=A0A0G2EKC0_9PEZI|nr:putative heterokaryon incompatibility protein [Diplodia seriata]
MTNNEICDCARPDIRGGGFGSLCLGCGRDVASEEEELAVSPPSESLDDDSGDEDYDGYDEIGPSDTLPAALPDAEYYESDPDSEDTAFRHRPIELSSDIRLIRLLPSGTYGDEICCNIVHAKLTDCEGLYEALSYTWGNPLQQETMRCNNTRFLGVTQNCADALRDLRHPVHERILWIDAICIDQSQIRERNHQVSLMSDIYSKAKRVVIYTGKDYSALQEHFGVLGSGSTRQLGSDRAQFQHHVSVFLSREWFRRVWVLQEVAMAREAVILFGGGQQSLNWTYLSIARLAALGVDAVDTLGATPPVLQLAQAEYKPLKDIISLLNVAGSCQSSDPRDKIYALLGLLDGANDLGLSADYGKSVEDLHQEVTVLAIKTYNHLDILTYVLARSVPRVTDDGEEEDYFIPHTTWVPNLHNLPREASLARWRRTTATPYATESVAGFAHLAPAANASARYPRRLALQVEILPLDRTDVVELEGHQRGAMYLSNNNSSSMEHVTFVDVGGPSQQAGTFVATAKDVRDALLSRGVLHEQFVLGGGGRSEEEQEQERSSKFWDGCAVLWGGESDGYGHGVKSLKKFSGGRQVRVTMRSVAICPNAMSRKDVICAVRGASVPFVLRRTGEEPGCFQVVGECYLHGFAAASASCAADDYEWLLGAYRKYFDGWQAWEMPEFFDMGTVDGEGRLPWTRVSLV